MGKKKSTFVEVVVAVLLLVAMLCGLEYKNHKQNLKFQSLYDISEQHKTLGAEFRRCVNISSSNKTECLIKMKQYAEIEKIENFDQVYADMKRVLWNE